MIINKDTAVHTFNACNMTFKNPIFKKHIKAKNILIAI